MVGDPRAASGVFRLRSSGQDRTAQIERSSPRGAGPARPWRVVFNRICLGCSAGARISPSAAQIRRHQRLAAQ